jgi:hypothetical protein
VVAAVTAVTMMVLVIACGGGGDKASTSGAAAGSGSSKTDFAATPVQLTADPCTLATKAEAEGVIGASVSQGAGANGRICTYTATGNGGIVSVEEVVPEFCKLLFLALDQNLFGGAQVRVDVGQGGMQVKGNGNVQVVVAGGCLTIQASKGDTKVDDATVLGLAKTATQRVEAAGGNPTPTTVNGTAGSGFGTPSRKPCVLLTKQIAEQALGIPVGAPHEAPGQGNETCNYPAADTSQIARVYLTTYAAIGSVAVLDQAAAQFTNAHAVDGVGDAARVSLEDHAIGVLKGDLVFGIGLIPPSQAQDITPVTEQQMIKLANAVLAEL